MRSIALAIGIVWAVFWVGWLVAAVTAKRGRRNGSGFAIRAGIVIVGILVFRLARGHVHSNDDVVQGAIGLALVVCGLAFAVWARVHIGRNWGPPMTVKLSGHELITSGPYRFVRNPIYSGILLALLGTAVALNLLLLIIVVGLGGYFVYSCKVEERIMLREHPDSYPAYRSRTKMLIPFVL
ncbi:isoprenylcysteine carboxylmethyltransferase family protein [Speluncibacter jeojiensis]|uniref:Isoprenylcysteine carboxylmethyltransferase family protein n=1 Tax=Speluncibacter jeojiensis TaxID=2710754 RepID=A0A9X4LXZ3_9ACTN|nr:isoprenylcysteine carboxylmethyltransferase family protein [Corynebacteriales bacterium D3-21]